MTHPRAADDFTTIRARMEELRREREEVQAAENGPQRDPPTHRARGERQPLGQISTGPGRVRQPGSGTQPDRDGAWSVGPAAHRWTLRSTR
jgi:hypothetical protein